MSICEFRPFGSNRRTCQAVRIAPTGSGLAGIQADCGEQSLNWEQRYQVRRDCLRQRHRVSVADYLLRRRNEAANKDRRSVHDSPAASRHQRFRTRRQRRAQPVPGAVLSVDGGVCDLRPVDHPRLRTDHCHLAVLGRLPQPGRRSAAGGGLPARPPGHVARAVDGGQRQRPTQLRVDPPDPLRPDRPRWKTAASLRLRTNIGLFPAIGPRAKSTPTR